MGSYGSWSRPIEYDDKPEATSTPAATPAPAEGTESQTPATDNAQAQFLAGAIATFALGFVPGLQVLWAGTAICVVVLLVSPLVGALESSSKAKAQANGGGGGDVLLAGVIIVLLAVFSFAFLLSLTEGAP